MESSSEFVFDSVEKAVTAFKRGELVVVMDDESRENEGDIIVAASLVTSAQVTQMILNTSGILCVAMEADRAAHLALPPMLINNTDPKQTAFTVSCDVEGTSTGVSAPDRALTIRALADANATASIFRKPGHIFPLVARLGGVIERRGHTEATVDMCKFAGITPAVGLLAELMNKDGEMSRLPECYAFAKQNGLCITTVEALVQYKQNLILEQANDAVSTPLTSLSHPSKLAVEDEKEIKNTASYKGCDVELLAECEIPIRRGEKYLGMWKLRCYGSLPDGHTRHAVLIKGDLPFENEGGQPEDCPPILARIHSECFTSHVLGSQRCDCSQQLDVCLDMINQQGRGVAIYVDGHEGRGIGLTNKIKAYHLQHHLNLDTYQANQELGLPVDSRQYEAPRAILSHLGLKRVTLMTNNPLKMSAFDDIAVDAVPVLCNPTEHNDTYIRAKRIFEAKHSDPSILTSPNLKRAAEQNKIRAQASYNPSPLSLSTSSAPSLTFSETEYSASLSLPSASMMRRLRIGIISTVWNQALVQSLASQCHERLKEIGISEDHIVREEGWNVPGAFELPFAAQRLARTGKVDAIICFGVLLKGDTSHSDTTASAVSQGLMQVQVTVDVPVLNGVLAGLTQDQAASRCAPSSSLHLSLASTAVRMAAFSVSTKCGAALPDQADSFCQIGCTRSAPMLQPCSQS